MSKDFFILLLSQGEDNQAGLFFGFLLIIKIIKESLVMVMGLSDLGFLLFSSLAFSPLEFFFFPQTLIFPAVLFDSLGIWFNL